MSTSQTKKEDRSSYKERTEFASQERQTTMSKAQRFMDDLPLVPWGQFYNDGENLIELKNTCPIDTTLQILLGLFVHHKQFVDFLKKLKPYDQLANAVGRVVDALLVGDFSEGKTVWIRDVMKLNMRDKNESFDMTRSELAAGYGLLRGWLFFQRYLWCGNERCTMYVNEDNDNWASSTFSKSKYDDITNMTFHTLDPSKVLEALNNSAPSKHHCSKCKVRGKRGYKLYKTPSFLFYFLEHNDGLMFPEEELDITQIIQGKRYNVFAYTTVRQVSGLSHFVTVFIYDDKIIVYDGLKPNPYIQSNHDDLGGFTSVWLIPE